MTDVRLVKIEKDYCDFTYVKRSTGRTYGWNSQHFFISCQKDAMRSLHKTQIQKSSMFLSHFNLKKNAKCFHFYA